MIGNEGGLKDELAAVFDRTVHAEHAGHTALAVRLELADRRTARIDERAVGQCSIVDGITAREAVSDVSGRGVGLSAVRQICRQLGGTVHVYSRRGQGTRFEFVFSAREETATARDARPTGAAQLS